MKREQSGTFVFHFGVSDDAAIVQSLAALYNCRKCQSFSRKGQMTIPNPTSEIGIVVPTRTPASPLRGL
jgi:hypothetical protein